MERLKELEEKRRQLKELRERRKHASVLSSETVLAASGRRPATPTPTPTPTMVSVSVQTDMEEAGTALRAVPAHHRRKEVITYDKGIQTEQIGPDQEQEDEGALATAVALVVENSSKVEDVQVRLELAKPVLVEDAAATLNDASFARLETFAPGAGEQSLRDTQQDLDGPMQWAMVSESVQLDSGCERVAQEYDPAKGILVVAYVRLPPAARRYASDETVWSVVNVVKCDSANGRNGQLVDLVEFRGTRVMSATILRREHHESQVVSILLTTFTGKTTLYELRLKQKYEAPAAYVVQRNMISRHYFQHPVVAVLETSSVRGQERVLVAADDGTVAELSCLDLSVLRAPRRLRPVPLSRLLALDDESSAYLQRLKRLAKFDEVGVASVAYTREDPQHVWVGAEDGGIYKVVWDQPGPLCLALDNNGFQPADCHSARVTGMAFCQDDARRLMLLLSCSTDWTVRLWDVRAGEAAAGAPLQLGAPVLRVRWLGVGGIVDGGGRSLRFTVWCADGRHVVAEWAFDSESSLYTAVVIS
ncbi:dynein intermediate chain [Saccharomyces pastorianus]|uniref:Dynein intermediate chain n=1 Tax=Saccharomyces pastorianus TaxID=27292 RepID=A0A6C1E5I4_SACPS|nr:dynein intermediate chain [Saccharomyces pastorianus]